MKPTTNNLERWEERWDKFYKDNYESGFSSDDIKQFISDLRKKDMEELIKLKSLSDKYAEVISLVYDGENVEKAEKIVGLR
jgi:uncharacterized protein (UPF0335 family)